LLQTLKIELPLTKAMGALKVFSEPTGAQIIIDANQAGIAPIKIDSLATGKHNLRIVYNGFFTIVDTFTIRVGETSNYSAKMQPAGSLKITSIPAGATVTLNDTLKEKTPFFSTEMVSGFYKLSLTYAGYQPEHDSVTVPLKTPVELSYELKHTSVWLDSVKMAKARKHANVQIVRRIVFSTLAIGFFADGLYMNHSAAKEISRRTDCRNAYQTGIVGADFDGLVAEFNSADSNIDRHLRYRNILYGLAGTFVLAAAISIPF
jgi:hypothetical protein